MTNAKPILEFENLSKRYPHRDGSGDLTVLDGLQRSIYPGEFVTLVGPSGCGKSTLFNLILGSQYPSEGELLLDGNPVVQPGPDRGVVYQKYGLYDNLTVLENVMLGGTMKRPVKANWLSSLHRKAIAEDKKKALEYLERVRLQDAADKYPHELSGGMKQRVAIAQALFTQPRILLMDEPFGALDAGTRLDAQLFLIELWEKFDLTVIFVTHSLEEAVFLGTRVLCLSQHYEHKKGPQSLDNGAKFVLDYDLSSFVQRRATISHEEYISKFTPLMDTITRDGMDPTVRQHMKEFHVGTPPEDDVLVWIDDNVLAAGKNQ